VSEQNMRERKTRLIMLRRVYDIISSHLYHCHLAWKQKWKWWCDVVL